jgi:hypothetical protein
MNDGERESERSSTYGQSSVWTVLHKLVLGLPKKLTGSGEIISENYHWLSFGCSLILFVLRLGRNFLGLLYRSLQSRHFHIQPMDLPF